MRFDKRERYSVCAMLILVVLFFLLALYFPVSMQLQGDIAGTMLSTELEIIKNYHLPPSLQSPLDYLDLSNEPPAFVLVTSVLSVIMGQSDDLKGIILVNYLFVKMVYLLLIPLFAYLIAKPFWGEKAIYSIFGAILAPFFFARAGPISNYVFITLAFVLALFCIFYYLETNNFKYMLILLIVYIFGFFTHQMVWIYEVVLASFFLLGLSKDKNKAIAFASYIICALSISALFIVQTGYTVSVSGVVTISRALLSLIAHIGPILSVGVLLAIWKRDHLPINKHYPFLVIIAVTFLSVSLFSYTRIYSEVIVLCSIAFAPKIGLILPGYNKSLNYAILFLFILISLSLSYHLALQNISTHDVFVTYNDISTLDYLKETHSERLLSNYDICLIISGEKMVLPFISTELDKYPELAGLKGFSRVSSLGQDAAENSSIPDGHRITVMH